MKSLYLAGPIVLLLAVFIFGEAAQLPGQPAGETSIQIAYVSARRVLNESPQGQDSVARMRAAQEERAAELRTKQQALEATRTEIIRGGAAEAMATLRQQEQQQAMELGQLTAQARNDLQALQRRIQNELDADVKPIIEEMAKERGIDLVLSGDGTVVYGAPSLDLTPAVLERLAATP